MLIKLKLRTRKLNLLPANSRLITGPPPSQQQAHARSHQRCDPCIIFGIVCTPCATDTCTGLTIAHLEGPAHIAGQFCGTK